MSARHIIEVLEREARVLLPVLFATLCVALPASAQSPLSLSEAIARARARNPDAGSAAAAEREAAERVTQARGGYFPKVDVAESWQRGNNPVFVFGSLLAQRQFTASRLRPRCAQSPRRHRQLPHDVVRRAAAVRSRHLGECPRRVDRAGHGGHRQATRRPRPGRGGDGRVRPRPHRRGDGSLGGGRRRDRPGRPRAGRQPPRRRPGDRRGCPAAGRLSGPRARTAGAGDVGRTHRARPAESVDGRALGHDVLARCHAIGDRHRHHQSWRPRRGSLDGTGPKSHSPGSRNSWRQPRWTRRERRFCRTWPCRAAGN